MASAQITNHQNDTIVEPKIYLPLKEKSTIQAMIPSIYFREKMSGALCDDAIYIHQSV